jgi:hypothetical protein
LETAEKHEEEPAPIAEGPTGAPEYVVQVQTSETAYAASDGICSVSVVGSEGEGPELALNDGAAVKKGELVEVRFTADLGEVSYVEFKNTSSETWRPHWVKVTALGSGSRKPREWYIRSRQFVSKTRTQKAYVDPAMQTEKHRPTEVFGPAADESSPVEDDDAAHARATEKYSENWDLCNTERRGLPCKNKHCKWRHLNR